MRRQAYRSRPARRARLEAYGAARPAWRFALNLPALHAFLTELKFNNSKDWFDVNRGRYQALRQEFIAFMGGVIQGVARTDPTVADVRAQDTLFRINRDVRFAHDKSPYKATFSAAISPGGRHSTLPIYYLQLGADDSLVAGGVYQPQAADLRIIRDYVQRYPGKADELLVHEGLEASFEGLGRGGMLKRFPQGYGEGSELLKFRSFTVSAAIDLALMDLADAGDLSAFVVQKCADMQPLHAWLREALAYRKP